MSDSEITKEGWIALIEEKLHNIKIRIDYVGEMIQKAKDTIRIQIVFRIMQQNRR